MDPEARRSMWATIEKVSATRSVVLVSHSMEGMHTMYCRYTSFGNYAITCRGRGTVHQDVRDGFRQDAVYRICAALEGTVRRRISSGSAYFYCEERYVLSLS